MPDEDKWVDVIVPEAMRIGPQGLADACAWRTRERAGRFQVCIEERYLNQQPRLFTLTKLADGSDVNSEKSFDRLRRWRPQPRPDWPPQVAAETRRLLASEKQEEWLAGFQILIQTVGDADLPVYLRRLLTATVEALPHASLWAIELEDRFHWRLAAARVLFGAAEAPELLERPRDRFEGFPSAKHLQSSTVFGQEVFVEPALMATAPFLLGSMASRYGGIVTMLFGTPLLGIHEAPAAELLQLYRARATSPQGLGRRARQEVSVAETEAFLRWWVRGLNLLLGRILDPARFRNSEGTYDPRTHFGMVLTLERFFASVQDSLSHTSRDEFVRRALMFDALDLLEGLGQGSYEVTLSHKRVNKKLRSLRKDLPQEAAAVGLPKAEKAAEALRKVQDGFFLTERRVDDERIRLRNATGGWEEKSVDTAVAHYLRVLRNANHSFKDIARDPREVGLLASHDALLSPDLSDIPYLHLLWMLSNPGMVLPNS